MEFAVLEAAAGQIGRPRGDLRRVATMVRTIFEQLDAAPVRDEYVELWTPPRARFPDAATQWYVASLRRLRADHRAG